MNTMLLKSATCDCCVTEDVSAGRLVRLGICMKHWRMVPVELRTDIKEARYAARAGLPGADARLLELVKLAFREINLLPHEQEQEWGEA